MEDKYYWIVIDKVRKVLFVVESKSCEATTLKWLQEKYSMKTYMDTVNRFQLFFNDNRNYIDYDKFYKKYAKWKVVEE